MLTAQDRCQAKDCNAQAWWSTWFEAAIHGDDRYGSPPTREPLVTPVFSFLPVALVAVAFWFSLPLTWEWQFTYDANRLLKGSK
jgi:hypothetical protein